MKMRLKRSSLMMITAVILTMTMIVGGTMAYLTDTDAAVNEFTMGDVDIELDENYVQGSVLMPGQAVPKTAAIKNVGTNPAYAIMTVAVPAVNGTPVVAANMATTNWTLMDEIENFALEGEEYLLYVYMYDATLAAGEATSQLLTSITLDEHIDYNPVTGKYAIVKDGVATDINTELTAGKVYVNAYAIQTTGFNTINEAYNAYVGQWGTWSQNQIIGTQDGISRLQLYEDLSAAAPGSTVVIPEAITGALTIPACEGITIDASNAKISKLELSAGVKDVTIEGLKIKAGNAGDNLVTLTADHGKVTIKNGEFEGVANVKSGHAISGGNGTELVVENCTIKNIGYGIQDKFSGFESLTVTNTTFENTVSWAILNQGTTKAVTVDHCTFTDCQAGILKTTGMAADGTLTFTNNTMTNCNAHNPYGLIQIGNEATCTKVFTNNTFDGNAYTY